MDARRQADSARPADFTRRVREAQVELVYAFPQRLLGLVINSALITGVVWDRVNHILLVVWLVLNAAVAFGRYMMMLAFKRRAPDSDIEFWVWAFTIGSSLSASLLGAATFIVWLTPDIANHVFIAFVIAGTISAATAMTYPLLPALYIYLSLTVIPLAVNFFFVSQGIYIVMGLMLVLVTILMIGQARDANAILLRSLRLQEENRSLVTDLSLGRDNLERRVQERTAELDAANATLRTEMAARLETESRLQQAQKMEAIGQLTGGIAHDFNNLLAVIQGNTELLSEQVGEGKQSRELRAILRASARGAQLTQRLLAFSRKQTLLPQPVDVNDLISSMMDMFGRTLGDDVLIVFKPAPDLPAAQVDPGQLENALLNLAINARDAMADGGEVTISSSSAYLSGEETEMVSGESPDAVKPGRYVVVEVRDTGKGIPADQLDKVWEPFFTTKRAGQGTGLGLSMVYGFLRQSGGQVAIDSRVGGGTTVTLFLPCAAGNEALRARTADITGVPTGTEYIFVIDDDVEIRVMVQKFLSRLGYRVVTAGSAEESFEKLVSHGKPDLFVSDVMLPGGNRGPNIVAGARKRFGPIPAVFMSGHAVAGFADVLGEGRKVTLINKPFELNQLARAVRRALDSSGDAGA